MKEKIFFMVYKNLVSDCWLFRERFYLLTQQSYLKSVNVLIINYNKAKDKNKNWNPPEFILDVMMKINNILQIKDENVFDSVTVAKEVVKNTFTIVSQVITTNKLIHENIR